MNPSRHGLSLSYFSIVIKKTTLIKVLQNKQLGFGLAYNLRGLESMTVVALAKGQGTIAELCVSFSYTDK